MNLSNSTYNLTHFTSLCSYVASPLNRTFNLYLYDLNVFTVYLFCGNTHLNYYVGTHTVRLPTSFTQLEKHLCARNCPLFRAIAQGPQWGPCEQLLLPAWITYHECGLILRVLFVLAAWYIRLM